MEGRGWEGRGEEGKGEEGRRGGEGRERRRYKERKGKKINDEVHLFCQLCMKIYTLWG